MCWGPQKESQVVVAFKVDQTTSEVEMWDITNSLRILEFKGIKGRIKAMSVFNIQGKSKLLTCTEEGNVEIRTLDQIKIDSELVESFQVSRPVTVLRMDPHHTFQCAIGGKENDLNIWDLENKTCLWKAKNVRNDMLDLQVPVWITDLQYLNNKLDTVVVATAHSQIRVYHLKNQRRPVLNVQIKEYPLTAIVLSHDDSFVIAVNTKGFIYKVDLTTGQIIGALKEIGGSINSIQFHPSLNYLISCGLNRYIIIHDTQTGKVKYKIYMKQKMTFILCDDENEHTVIQKENTEKTKEERLTSENQIQMKEKIPRNEKQEHKRKRINKN